MSRQLGARRRVDIDQLPADHGGERREPLDLALRDGQVIGRENDEIGELAGLDGALELFFERDARVIDGVGAHDTIARRLDAHSCSVTRIVLAPRAKRRPPSQRASIAIQNRPPASAMTIAAPTHCPSHCRILGLQIMVHHLVRLSRPLGRPREVRRCARRPRS